MENSLRSKKLKKKVIYNFTIHFHTIYKGVSLETPFIIL